MNLQAQWITAPASDTAPVFKKDFDVSAPIRRATLRCTALGVYETCINGRRVGDFVLAPGWTVYRSRLQVQEYDVTALIAPHNTWTAVVGCGWYGSPLGWVPKEKRTVKPKAFLAELTIEHEDGAVETIGTGPDWQTAGSPVLFSEIYDGETYDATVVPSGFAPASILDYGFDTLISQQGEEIREQERVAAQRVFRTPAGEIMVDFGQEVTGYVEFSLNAKAGEKVRILHSEVLDQSGNFYNDNYRAAKAEINYICKDGPQTYHPRLTFFGFRLIKLEAWPQSFEEIKPQQFTAIVVHSQLKRTGRLASSSPLLNQLFSNVIWGQKGNFLDVPTDCPQRDERLGWTGDAQVFCKAASYNFDVRRFFAKWLADMAADQLPGGGIPHVVPDVLNDRGKEVDGSNFSAAWADAACVCPWQMYMTYGDREVLCRQFAAMKKWVDYITTNTSTPGLWTGGAHFGDWLGLDAPSGSYKGSSREALIASAFYANSTHLVIEAGHVLGEDVGGYEALYNKIVEAFRKEFPSYETQTEHILAVQFNLSKNPQATADALAEMVRRDGCMKTGFVGTPYLLHVLSDYGYGELAYGLLLREEYPSWLYPVKKGATTIWEHWDGIMEDGGFWSRDMNSFNHYAYGSVVDWVYEKALGILPIKAGFEKIRIAPIPTDKLDWLEGSIETSHGVVRSKWSHVDGRVRYEVSLPVAGEAVIGGKTYHLDAGDYLFWQ